MQTLSQKYLKIIRQNFTNEDIGKLNQAVDRQLSGFELLLCSTLFPYNKRTTDKWFKKLLHKGKDVIFEPSPCRPGAHEVMENVCCLLNLRSNNTDDLQVWLKNMQETSLQVQIQAVDNTGVLGLLNIGSNILNIENDIKKFINQADIFSKHFAITDLSLQLHRNSSFYELPQICHFAFGTASKKDLASNNQNYKDSQLFILQIDKTNSADIKANDVDHPNIEPDLLGFFDSKLLIDTIKKFHSEKIIQQILHLSAGGILETIYYLISEINQGITLKIDNAEADVEQFYVQLIAENEGILLFVSPKENEKKIGDLLKPTPFRAVKIGEVTREEKLQIFFNKEKIASLPIDLISGRKSVKLSDRVYERPEKKIRESGKFSIDKIPQPTNLKELSWELSRAIHLQYRKWCAQVEKNQYATMYIDVPKTTSKIAINSITNERYMRTNPQAGAAMVFAEAVKNVICSGAEPFAFAISFNIGNQDDSVILWQFIESIKGINKMCRLYNLPVISTDICFIPEEANAKLAINLAVLGIAEKTHETTSPSFKKKGDMIFLIGESKNDLSSSFYINYKHDIVETPAPYFELSNAFKLKNILSVLIQNEIVNSAQSIAEGGIFYTLVKAGFENSLGFDITTDAELRTDVFLFSEAKNRVIVTVSGEKETDFIDYMVEQNFPFTTLGHVTKGEMRVDDVSFGKMDVLKDFILK